MGNSSLLMTAFGLPVIEKLSRTTFWSQYRESQDFDFSTAAEREAIREKRLGDVLEAARETPLHRQRLAQASLANERVKRHHAVSLLDQLAPVGKDELKRNFPSGVLTSGPSEDRAYLVTSGTTADRMTVVSDFAKRDAGRSGEMRGLKIALDQNIGVRCVEIPPNVCNAVCGLGDALPKTFSQDLRAAIKNEGDGRARLRGRIWNSLVYRNRILPPLDPGPAERVRAALDARLGDIQRDAPVLLRGFPQYLLWLSERAAFRGIKIPSLRAIAPYGGLVSPKMGERIAQNFGADFRNIYGTSELGPIAAACSNHPAMHLFEDHFIVEIFHDGKPAPAGAIGELVITDLTNRAMPVIRYRVGDVGRLVTKPCDCGRKTTRLEVMGRIGETLQTPKGPLTSSEVSDALLADPGLSNFRVEETAPDRFDITFVGPLDGPAARPEDIRDRFAELHGGVRHVRARTAAYVLPEPNGKYKLVHPAPRAQGPFCNVVSLNLAS